MGFRRHQIAAMQRCHRRSLLPHVPWLPPSLFQAAQRIWCSTGSGGLTSARVSCADVCGYWPHVARTTLDNYGALGKKNCSGFRALGYPWHTHSSMGPQGQFFVGGAGNCGRSAIPTTPGASLWNPSSTHHSTMAGPTVAKTFRDCVHKMVGHTPWGAPDSRPIVPPPPAPSPATTFHLGSWLLLVKPSLSLPSHTLFPPAQGHRHGQGVPLLRRQHTYLIGTNTAPQAPSRLPATLCAAGVTHHHQRILMLQSEPPPPSPPVQCTLGVPHGYPTSRDGTTPQRKQHIFKSGETYAAGTPTMWMQWCSGGFRDSVTGGT